MYNFLSTGMGCLHSVSCDQGMQLTMHACMVGKTLLFKRILPKTCCLINYWKQFSRQGWMKVTRRAPAASQAATVCPPTAAVSGIAPSDTIGQVRDSQHQNARPYPPSLSSDSQSWCHILSMVRSLIRLFANRYRPFESNAAGGVPPHHCPGQRCIRCVSAVWWVSDLILVLITVCSSW